MMRATTLTVIMAISTGRGGHATSQEAKGAAVVQAGFARASGRGLAGRAAAADGRREPKDTAAADARSVEGAAEVAGGRGLSVRVDGPAATGREFKDTAAADAGSVEEDAGSVEGAAEVAVGRGLAAPRAAAVDEQAAGRDDDATTRAVNKLHGASEPHRDQDVVP